MRYFSHAIDDATGYCTGCGSHLLVLMFNTAWRGKRPLPVCAEVTGISHIVRRTK